MKRIYYLFSIICSLVVLFTINSCKEDAELAPKVDPAIDPHEAKIEILSYSKFQQVAPTSSINTLQG